MNQYDGSLTAAILKAAARPNGVATNEIDGYTVAQVGRVIDKLKTKGQLFVAKLSHRSARYYADEATAKANTPAPQPAVTVRSRLVPHSAWDDLAPAILPKGIRVTKCPSPPESRYVVDTAPPCFSSLRPGQYIDQAPKPWVEAATA